MDVTDTHTNHTVDKTFVATGLVDIFLVGHVEPKVPHCITCHAFGNDKSLTKA